MYQIEYLKQAETRSYQTCIKACINDDNLDVEYLNDNEEKCLSSCLTKSMTHFESFYSQTFILNTQGALATQKKRREVES
mmetsp:Transcript_88084/g.121493  ORF Transcript_88084/g.121493 Transcript_88084/m.121493 type:complete len:80 (+) Transcript_88084:148-387(+)